MLIPNCKNFLTCKREAKTKRSTLCATCFRAQACRSGARRGNPGDRGRRGGIAGNRGNVLASGKRGHKGNARGNPGNRGNPYGSGKRGHKGNANASGSRGNRGNAFGSGNPGNCGNKMKGAGKGDAGRRSGVRRCTHMALTIKKKWLDLILAGTKTWEIRGTSTAFRGFIHFAESGSGQLRGRAQLVGCRQLNRRKFMKYQHKHQVPNAEMVTYKNIWAWILKDAEPYENSFHYSHTQGAVIFVKVRKPMGPGNHGNANAKRKATAAAGKRQSRGLTATSVEPPTGPEDCQNCNVPRNQHCGSREAPNEKKNKPVKEQWKFVVDPTSEPSWSDVALSKKDLHRKVEDKWI